MKAAAGYAVGLAWAWMVCFGPSPWREGAVGILGGCIVVGVVLAVVHAHRARRRPVEAEVAAVAALAALYPDARVEGPGGVVFEPYVCEDVPCEPDDGGELQPDGTRVFGCLWCSRKWVA